MMKNIRLFHLYEQAYTRVIREIERSKRKNILQQSVSVYAGLGRYAILSGDDEVNAILNQAGCHELSREATMLKAIAQDPDIFQFCYGNKELLPHLN